MAAAPPPPPPSQCMEETIPLLRNENLLCWFDSGNFALFHKRRPELDAFFAVQANKEKGWDIIEEVYNHFSGTSKKTTGAELRALMERLRASPELRTFFNSGVGTTNYKVKTEFTKRSSRKTKGGAEETDDAGQKDIKFEKEKTVTINKITDTEYEASVTEPGTDTWTYFILLNNTEIANFEKIVSKDFLIEGNGENDSTEYIHKFFNKDIFNTIAVTSSASNPNSFISTVESKKIKILDIVKETTFKIAENTHTIFVETGYNKVELDAAIPKNYPETILLPFESKENIIFKLDAIVVHTGGNHYFVVVRCGDTDDWLLYDDMKVGDGETLEKTKKEKIFLKYPEIKFGTTDINAKAKVLIYSR